MPYIAPIPATILLWLTYFFPLIFRSDLHSSSICNGCRQNFPTNVRGGLPHARLFPNDEFLHQDVEQAAQEQEEVAVDLQDVVESVDPCFHNRRASRDHRSCQRPDHRGHAL